MHLEFENTFTLLCLRSISGKCKRDYCNNQFSNYLKHFQKWKQDVSLKSNRAYAASAILPNGDLWISGGVGSTKILDSIEILIVKG